MLQLSSSLSPTPTVDLFHRAAHHLATSTESTSSFSPRSVHRRLALRSRQYDNRPRPILPRHLPRRRIHDLDRGIPFPRGQRGARGFSREEGQLTRHRGRDNLSIQRSDKKEATPQRWRLYDISSISVHLRWPCSDLYSKRIWRWVDDQFSMKAHVQTYMQAGGIRCEAPQWQRDTLPCRE